jgi:N-acetylglucosaminyl-diphospho-decaprenol L-rhamnosyltransferase
VSDAVGAVVVNYNAGGHLVDCVRSLRSAGVDEVVVVDNASVDASLATLAAADPDATVVHAGRNFGYGGGVNRGLAALNHEYVLVLNADVVVEAGAVPVLAAVLDAEPGVGIVGPRVTEVDGTPYPSARTFPNLADAVGHAFLGLRGTDNRFSRRYLRADRDADAAADVDWVSGSCFLARRTTLDAIGGFDEAYFMYLEDVDLCWRAGHAGWRVRYEPAAAVTHVGGVSTEQTPYRMLAAHHRSLFRFWWRTSPPARRVLAPIVGAGLGLRLVVMAARRALNARRRN